MDTSRNTAPHRSIRAATLGVALTAIIGVVTPVATLADDAIFTPITRNQLSIMLVESKEASSDTAFVPVSQNQQSIMLTESKEAPGGILAGGSAPPARIPYEESEHAVAQNHGAGSAQDVEDDTALVPMTQNQLTIMLVESKEAPGGVLAGGEFPDFVQTANGRSIALTESKEAPGGMLATGGAN